MPGQILEWANNKKLTQNSKTNYFSAIDFSQGSVKSRAQLFEPNISGQCNETIGKCVPGKTFCYICQLPICQEGALSTPSTTKPKNWKAGQRKDIKYVATPGGASCEHVLTVTSIAMLCGLSSGKYEENIKKIFAEAFKSMKKEKIKAIEKSFFNFRNELLYGIRYDKKVDTVGSGIYGTVYQWSHPGCNEIKNELPYLKIDFMKDGPKIDKVCLDNIRFTIGKLLISGNKNGETKTSAYWKQMAFLMFNECEMNGFFKKGISDKSFWKAWNYPTENWYDEKKPPEKLAIITVDKSYKIKIGSRSVKRNLEVLGNPKKTKNNWYKEFLKNKKSDRKELRDLGNLSEYEYAEDCVKTVVEKTINPIKDFLEENADDLPWFSAIGLMSIKAEMESKSWFTKLKLKLQFKGALKELFKVLPTAYKKLSKDSAKTTISLTDKLSYLKRAGIVAGRSLPTSPLLSPVGRKTKRKKNIKSIKRKKGKTLKRKHDEDSQSYTKRLKHKSSTSTIKLTEADKMLVEFYDKYSESELDAAYALLDLAQQKIPPQDVYTGLLLLNFSGKYNDFIYSFRIPSIKNLNKSVTDLNKLYPEYMLFYESFINSVDQEAFFEEYSSSNHGDLFSLERDDFINLKKTIDFDLQAANTLVSLSKGTGNDDNDEFANNSNSYSLDNEPFEILFQDAIHKKLCNESDRAEFFDSFSMIENVYNRLV